jgi:3',5'-cyclic AMP phosphodiesterase CpdA
LLRFLHCSDVHVTEDYSIVPWRKLGWRRWIALAELKLGRAEAFAQARQSLAQIARQAELEKVDHLIVSGDVTAYSLESEFKGARDALGSIAEQKQRCTVIPGNHDRYTPGSFSSRRFERYFGQLLESDLPEYCREGPFPFVRFVGEEAAVIGLCSARVPPVPGISLGAIGKRQLDGLGQAVRDDRLSHRAVLVVVHHAPLTQSGKKDSLTHGLWDGDALLRTIPGPRFALLHGHIHRRYYHPASDTRPHIFGAGSSTQRGSEGYWLIEVSDGKILGGLQRALRPQEIAVREGRAAQDLKVGGA